MKALVILNPPSGEGERQGLCDALRGHFGAAGIACEIFETRKEDRLTEVVRRRLRGGFDLVVAAGGDGTVSAVCDALVGGPIPLGIIPTGTGNLIARELHIPDEVGAAVAVMAGAAHTRKIDAMRIGKRVYLLNASVGISASVIGETTRRGKSRFGLIAYVVAVLRKALSSRPRALVVEVDGKVHGCRAVDVSIMNCGHLARVLYPKGPEIQIDDGHLGVWILSMKSHWDYLRYVMGVVAGSTVSPKARFIRAAKRVRIRSRAPWPVQADGDLIGTTPIEAVVLPGAITVMVPGKTADVPEEGAPSRAKEPRHQAGDRTAAPRSRGRL
jgi:diacylglycerol kinase (ATP)